MQLGISGSLRLLYEHNKNTTPVAIRKAFFLPLVIPPFIIFIIFNFSPINNKIQASIAVV